MDGDQATIERAENGRSARTTTRTSPRTQRVEVITGSERRRRWSIEEKREIVAESLRPDIGASGVVRRYGISSGQLYTWRRQLTQRLGSGPPGPSTNFARVDVVVAERQEEADPPSEARVPLAGRHAAVPLIAPRRAEGLIEIMLPSGTSVRVDAQVDVRALRRVLGALYGR
jgi:transposase